VNEISWKTRKIFVAIYLEKIAQPYYFWFRISDHFTKNDNRISFDRFSW